MSFGFKKEKSVRRSLGAAELSKKVSPVSVDQSAEERAVKAGELKGFKSRESLSEPLPTETIQTIGRKKRRQQQGKILIAGPKAVLDRFISYADENDHSAYWNALEKLLDTADRD